MGMNKERARVAVIVPYYNSEKTIVNVLNALARSIEPVDIILIDDASTNLIPSNLDKEVSPQRLTLIKRSENNPSAVLNTGIQVAISEGYEFIAINDADDVPHDEKFSKQLAFMDEHESVGMLGTWANFYNGMDNALMWVMRHPVHHKAIVKAMRSNAAFVHSSVLYRTSMLPSTRPYDESLPVAKDYAMALRMVRLTQVANLPEVLLDYYVWPTSISTAKRNTQLNTRIKLQLKYFDWSDFYAWVGVIRTVLLYLVPLHLNYKIKESIMNAK